MSHLLTASIVDVKRTVPSPSVTETFPMPTLQFERDRKTGLHDIA